MNIDTKVISKKLGPPVTGFIVGLEKMPEVKSPLWKIYPESTLMAKVRVTSPVKIITFEEFCYLYQEKLASEPDPLLCYLNSVPYTREMFYPIEDLEQIE